MRLKKYEFNCVNSTNDTAIKLIQKGNEKGIIFSDNQKKGKGRYGKKWISIKGNLFVSIFFQIKKIYKLKNINKKNCKILKSLLSKHVNYKIDIKYPNDLLINKKKICGILQEIKFFNEAKFIIIGVGINLIKNPKIKNYPTTNILKETGIKVKKYDLIKNIEKSYIKNLKLFA